MRRTIEGDKDQTHAPLLRSRIGRRVVGLFILSALVPLALCAVFLFRAFDTELIRAQQQSLDGLVRSFGMTLLGRLGSVDDVLKAIVSAPGATDTTVLDSAAKLPWVREVRGVKGQRAPNDEDQVLPVPDVRQRRAVETGEPALLWGLDQSGNSHVYLVRRLPSGAWVYAEIASAWLWSGAGEFAADAGLLMLDDAGQEMASAGTVPREWLRAGMASTPVPHNAIGAPTRDAALLRPDRWISRSWEVFLGGRFSSPPWHLAAIRARSTLLTNSNDSYLYLCGFILLTILMISWLSMTTIRRQMRPLIC